MHIERTCTTVNGEQRSMQGPVPPVSYSEEPHQPSWWFGPLSGIGIFIFSHIFFISCPGETGI